jgi:phosphoglucosamine mutase
MILIGKDTRLSGYLIESALTSGICSMVTLPLSPPTPGSLSYETCGWTRHCYFASHNPFEDNGIKFFSAEGFKLPDEIERKIEELVGDDELLKRRPRGAGIGKAYRLDDATGRYIEYIKSTIPKGITFEGLKVVVDSANGAAYKTTPWAAWMADAVSINDRRTASISMRGAALSISICCKKR